MKGIQDIWYPQTVRRHLLTLHGRSVSKVRCQGLKEVCLIKVNISCRAKCSTVGTESNWQEKQAYRHMCWRRLRMDTFAFGTKTILLNSGQLRTWKGVDTIKWLY